MVCACDVEGRLHLVRGQIASGFAARRAVPDLVGYATPETLVNARGVVPATKEFDLALDVEQRREEKRDALPEFQSFQHAFALSVEPWILHFALDETPY